MLHHPLPSKIVRLVSLSFLVAMTGCPPIPKSQEEVGAVNVSVTLVAPWEEYVVALTPNFTLTATEAVNKVIPRTGILEEKILDALGFSARIGFPQTSELSTKTINTKTTKADGEETKETTDTTEDRTEKKEPGKLPDAPSKAQGSDKGIKELQGAPADSAKLLHNDPMLEYTAATALYQEVQLLNRYVTDAALRHDMDAYVVRLQIGIVPFRRNLGYDLYTKIGFFPKTADGRDSKAFVLPLLVTDNLEGALASRAQDTIRQLSLAISFMKAGIVGTLGADRVKEELESELFTEINSLFTIGRITNNTLGARFGAVRRGKDRYSIIPRTHNVTLVLMVPKEFGERKEKTRFLYWWNNVGPENIAEKNNEVRVVAKTSMRSTTDGTILPQQGRYERSHHVGEAVKTFLRTKEKIDSVETAACDNSDPQLREKEVLCTQAILQSIWANDYEGFEKALEEADWKSDVGRFSRDLWMDIVESLDKSQFSGVRFELPNRTRTPSLPNDQVILLLDDGKSQMRTSLTGGRGLVPNEIRTILHLKLETGEIVPLAGSIAAENGGTDLVLSFPSPNLWKLNKFNPAETILELEQRPRERWNPDVSLVRTYSKVAYRKANDPIKPAFTITKTVDVVKPDTSYHGSVSLFVEFVKDVKKAPLAKQVEISVEGADLTSAQFTGKGTTVKKPHTPELGRVIVGGDGTLELELKNLDRSKKVIIKSVAKDKDDKAVGGDQSDVILDVSQAPPK